jgi:CelD/BcsL family acetyltransferase involved in cellulose biosynthesis
VRTEWTDDPRAVEPAWRDLWNRDPEATPFQGPDWLIPWTDHLGFGDPRIALVRDRGGRLVALAPMLRTVERGGPKLLSLGFGVTDYLDPLVDPAAGSTAPMLLSRTLADAGATVELHDQRTARLADGVIADQSPAPVLSLAAGEDGFRRSVRPSAFRHWAQALRRAQRLGTVTFERADVASLPALLDALFALHGERWSRDGGNGVLADPTVRAFHQAAAPRLLAAGQLRLAALRIGGRTVAVHLGVRDRVRTHGYIGGHDASLPGQSLGTLILGHAIATAVAESCAEYHFLRGDEAYKAAWGARPRWTRIVHLAPVHA